MILFWGAATALVVLALAFVLPALLRRGAQPPMLDGARHSTLPILKDQLKQLEAEHTAGRLGAEQYRLGRAEVERRVLEEVTVNDRRDVIGPARKTAVFLMVAIPLLTFGLYATQGNLQGLAPAPTTANAASKLELQEVEAMVASFAKRMENQPNNLQGWTMLARSYAKLQRFPQADRAYARARALAPNNAQLLTDHAEVLAVIQGQLAGEPDQLIAQALQLAPTNLKALFLAGSAAFERSDFAVATIQWQKALELSPPGSELAISIERSLSQARAAAAEATPAIAGTAPAHPTVQSDQDEVGSFISGRVSLAPELAAHVAPTDTVFIFARAAKGPRIPLAVVRRSASELPISFTLDDSMAMLAHLKISKFANVTVQARVSKSGDATAHPGDLQGQTGVVRTGSRDIEVFIDSVKSP